MRLNSEIQKALSEMLVGEIKDPRLDAMITVTKVATDEDLKNAKVWLSVYPNDAETKQNNLAAVVASSGFLRSGLARRLPNIRQTPALKFFLDESLDYGEKINKMLDDLK